MNDVYVVGVGMIPFTKPGASDPYPTMGATAAKLALEDAGIDYRHVQQAPTSPTFEQASLPSRRFPLAARLRIGHAARRHYSDVLSSVRDAAS